MKTIMWQRTKEETILFTCECEEGEYMRTFLKKDEHFISNLFSFIEDCEQSAIQIKMLFRSLERYGVIGAK